MRFCPSVCSPFLHVPAAATRGQQRPSVAVRTHAAGDVTQASLHEGNEMLIQ